MNHDVEVSQVFLDRYRLLQQDQAELVDTKLKDLIDHPDARGTTKTPIVGTQDPKRYRLRVGDLRVIYSFDDGVLRIWDVNKRSEVYRRKWRDTFVPVREDEIADDDVVEVIEDAESGADFSFACQQLRAWLNRFDSEDPSAHLDITIQVTRSAQNARPAALPRTITPEELESIGIEAKYYTVLAACRTDVDLIEAMTVYGIPGEVVDRVFAVVAEPDDATLTEQPLWRIREVEDLTRFYGDLLKLQRALDKEQKEFAATIARNRGSWLVRGGPGTGKSTVLLVAAADLYRERRNRGEQPKILVTTYTSALVTTLEAQLDHILPGPRPGFEVRTVDSIVKSIVAEAQTGKKLSISKTSTLLGLLQVVTEETLGFGGKSPDYRTGGKLPVVIPGDTIPHRSLAGMSWQYLLDEIELVIVARNIRTLEEYLTEPRYGRRLGLSEIRRRVAWKIAMAFERELTRNRWSSYTRRRRHAADLLESGQVTRQYDAVFADETQDLQPNAIRMLVEAASLPDQGVQYLVLAADMNQTIYGTGISWRSMHTELRIQGRSRTLRTNHRSTKQILEAAEAYLIGAELEDEKTVITHRQHGPIPEAVLGITVEDEVDHIMAFFRAHCGQIDRDIDMCAVLVPTDKRGNAMHAEFRRKDIPARYMRREKVDMLFRGVKILIRHTAKGLEFPIVALSLVDGLPLIDGDNDEAAEARQKERRVNHMAMTRATRSLLVTLPEDADPDLVAGIAEPLWRVETHS